MKVANGVLARAAAAKRRLAVPTEYGVVRGYLLGMDEHTLVLYADYRTKDEYDTPLQIWTVCVLPRSLTVFIEPFVLTDEADHVRGDYLKYGGDVFIATCPMFTPGAIRIPEIHKEDTQ